MNRRVIRSLIGAVALLALLVAPVSASHTHVMQVGNGQCVLLAEGAGEAGVSLPAAVFANNPNVTIAPTTNRMHPLHVLVHLGQAGTNHAMAVYGTAAATSLCSAGIVNR